MLTKLRFSLESLSLIAPATLSPSSLNSFFLSFKLSFFSLSFLFNNYFMFSLRTSLPLYHSIFHNNSFRLFPVKILPKLLIAADRHVHFHSSRRLVLTSYTQAPFPSTTATTNPQITSVIYHNIYKMSSSEDDMPLAKTNGHSKFFFYFITHSLTQWRLEEFTCSLNLTSSATTATSSYIFFSTIYLVTTTFFTR